MSEIRVDTISEKTSANGVAIDSLSIKDGSLSCAAGAAVSISSDGEVTKPLQPAFHVEPASQQSNMATGAQLVFGTENFDIGSNFASNTFTAPVTGKYFIGHSLRLQSLDSAASYYLIQITGSNRSHYHMYDPDGLSQDSSYREFTNGIVLDMDANDTVDLAFAYSGGAQQVDLSTASYFYGYLLG